MLDCWAFAYFDGKESLGMNKQSAKLLLDIPADNAIAFDNYIHTRERKKYLWVLSITVGKNHQKYLIWLLFKILLF